MSTTSYRPLDGEIAGTVEDTAPDELARVTGRAAEAASAVAAAAPRERRAWLHEIASALEADAAELAALAQTETGLGLPRLEAEIARTAAQLRFYGDVAVEGSFLGVAIDEATAHSPRLVRVNRPRGPVAVLGASNFPFAFGVLGNDTGSAIAAGCPVVVKAHPAHVLLSVRLAGLATAALQRAGAPDGTFQLVIGHQCGIDLVRAAEIKAVCFTGSQSGGLALWRIANERDEAIPMFAEMGTVNPAVVTPAGAARLAEVASGFVGSFTLGAGQFCTKPGLLFAPAGSDAARAVATALTAAAPLPTMLTETIAASVASGVRALEAAGATVVGSTPGPATGWSADATVLSAPISALRPGSSLLDECFGPVAVVVEYHDRDELLRGLEALQPSLAAAVFAGGDEDEDAAYLIERLSGQVGRVTRDDWPTGVAWTWAQQHGGPWPATTAASATSVGAAALDRFVRPVAFQSVPDGMLPPSVSAAVAPDNPWRIPRRVNGVLRAP